MDSATPLRTSLVFATLLLAWPAQSQTTLVSGAPGGGAALGGASGQFGIAVSGSGRFVVFESAATNLVANDTNGVADVFVHDRHTGTTTRVNVAPGGRQAIGGPSGVSGVAISGDGRVVAFESSATNLVAGDTNGVSDIFVHDRESGVTTRVSLATGGGEAHGGAARRPALSADGRIVVFDAAMTDLVAGDNNGAPDVFAHDRTSGATTRLSVATGGAEAVNASVGSVRATVSADGRLVAFTSDATNLVTGDTNNTIDAFVHDRGTGVTTRVSVRSGGVQATGGDSFRAAISADGRFVAFDSEASVVTGDTNGDRDIFVHDRQTGQSTRVSVATGGVEANGQFGSRDPFISADGRYIGFSSDAPDLDTDDTNGTSDMFLHDRSTGRTTRISLSSANVPANAPVVAAAMSADGRYVAFSSSASTLRSGDANQLVDVFVRDTRMFLRRRLSVTTAGGQLARPSVGRPAVSAEGRYVAFTTAAAGIDQTDTNGRTDVFVRDWHTNLTARVSVASGGGEGGGGSGEPSLSADGRLVAFESVAEGLVADDSNRQADVFVHDRATGRTTRVSVTSDGTQAKGASRFPAISANGRVVVFASSASNLAVSDTNTRWDVFARDLVSGVTTQVSVASGGHGGSGDRTPPRPTVSADGQIVAFVSAAPDLVAQDSNGREDLFLHDRATGQTTRVDLQPVALGGYRNLRDPALSGDGRTVAFVGSRSSWWPPFAADRSDVLVHERPTGAMTIVSASGATTDLPALDHDGGTVAFDRASTSWGTTTPRQVFTRDVTGGAVTQVSLGDSRRPNASSVAAATSADGRVVAFRSTASALVDGDTNGLDDVFMRATVPVVRDVFPREGATAGGAVVQIHGEGFRQGTTVTIGGTAVTSVTVVDAGRVDIVVPPHAEGLVDLAVKVPGFDAEHLRYGFTYRLNP